MKATTAERVQKHRNNLRASGLRPVQIWVPDTRSPEFAKECIRQSKIIAKAEAKDRELRDLLDAALADIDGWV